MSKPEPFAAWGAQLAEWEAAGQAPVRTMLTPSVRPMSANPDAPLESGGVPFWTRALQAWPGNPLAGSKAIQSAGEGTRDTVVAVKDRIAVVGVSVANAGSGFLNRIIIVMVLVLVGWVLLNRFAAKAVTA